MVYDQHARRAQILLYHEETKHLLHRYARSTGSLDWATQPDPFRSWDGAPLVLLPLLKKDPETAHLDLYLRHQNSFWDFNLQSVGAFLELSLGLSAWKQIPPDGSKWALRMNPSSGNLHPTEAHLVLPPLEGPSRLGRVQKEETLPALGLSPDSGVYHYHPYRHALEQRAVLSHDYLQRLQSHFRSPGFLIALTSIAWREAWKYGERALRYCHHDVGHALGALSFAGNLLGWRVTWLNAVGSEELNQTLGLEKITWPSLEDEDPDVLCFVSPSSLKAIPRALPPDWLAAMKLIEWKGAPSAVSSDHVEWDLLTKTAEALRRPATPETSVRLDAAPLRTHPISAQHAAALIRQRRSAVAYDGLTTLSTGQFYALLDKTLPRANVAPFDVELGAPRVHLAIFVHRVLGLPSGLYFWLRETDHLADLKRSFKREFAWTLVEENLPLYLLKEGNFEATAAHLSCGQSIAGQSAFSLGMIARFLPVIQETPWEYKTLFWECGLIGQVLYLEAEAQGVRATGIGCFFDNEMHSVLGLRDANYQSLYHFTVGGAVEDARLQTLAAYAHLPADRR